MERAVARSVTEGTKDGYGASWKKWMVFLGTIEKVRRPAEFLQSEQSDEDRVTWLCLFVDHLYTVEGMREATRVARVLSGVRFQWKSNSIPDSFFDSKALVAVKRGTNRTPDEAREEAMRVADTEIKPVCVEIMVQMRKTLWVETRWDVTGSDKKAIWIAAGVAFDSGLRPCNVRGKDGKKAMDHCIRANHFRFEVVNEAGQKEILCGGEQIRSFLMQAPDCVKRVLGAEYVVLTTKTSSTTSLTKGVKKLGRGSSLETELLEDLCEFNLRSGVRGDDPFTARYCPLGRRKVPTNKDLTAAIKDAVGFFGLPKANFSAKSLRSGFASLMTAVEADRQHLAERGGWSARSTVPEGHYIYTARRGAMAASVKDGEVLGGGVEGIRKMFLPGAVLVDSRASV